MSWRRAQSRDRAGGMSVVGHPDERRGEGAPRRARWPARGLTLVETLVVVAVGSVVVGMLVVGWFSLTGAYSATTTSSAARAYARDAVSRLAREIRDMEPHGGNSAFLRATATEIEFTTTFNVAGNTVPRTKPVRTLYAYDTTQQCLRRMRDLDGNGTWDRQEVVVRHLLNYDPGSDTWKANPFEYTWMGSDRIPVVTATPSSFAGITMVRVRLLVDLNPGRAPAPMDLSTTVQLRNRGRY